MFKELLLQFVVSLLPVFAFQLWHEKDREWNCKSLFMGAFCIASMLLCMVTGPDFYDYDLDFRMIPYMIGSLYGGIPVMAILTVIYVLMRLPYLDSAVEIVIFGIFFIGYVALMLKVIGPFQQLPAQRKKRAGFLITGLIVSYFTASICIYILFLQLALTAMLIGTLLLTVLTFLVAAILSFYMIESVKEKQLLHDEVSRLSVNYRNEVDKLQQFIDHTSFAVLIVDHNGNIIHFNDSALELLSIRPEYINSRELLGVHFSFVFQADEGDSSLKLLAEALDGNKASFVPFVDDTKTLLKTTFAIKNSTNNQLAGAAIIAHDVTEINQLRFEVGHMERLSLVGQMAASITHEIRNPMAVIRGFVQLLQERSPNNQHEYFRIIIDELDRANMIISDFLSLAQNRSLSMELSSLNDIINELMPLLNADANLRSQTIITLLDDELPLLMLNSREIKQLLLNIVRNGMEAMTENGVLTISTTFNDYVITVSIADEGAGIPHEIKKHLFEPFFTTKTRGTGLGLPLCLSIAERHKGSIDVDSTEGKGTTFIVTFNRLAEETNV